MDGGFKATDAWGPVQMGVSFLRIEGNQRAVELTSERGCTHVELLYEGTTIDLRLATLTWARTKTPAGTYRDPSYFPPARVEPPFDYPAYVRGVAEDVAHLDEVLEGLPGMDRALADFIDKYLERYWPSLPNAHEKRLKAYRDREAFEDALGAFFAEREPAT